MIKYLIECWCGRRYYEDDCICPACLGKGRFFVEFLHSPKKVGEFISVERLCEDCKGTGVVPGCKCGENK